MGRRIPTEENMLINPLLSLPMMVAGIAATVSIIASLCGVRFRRKSSPAAPPDKTSNTLDATTNQQSVTINATMSPPTPQTTSRLDSEDATENESQMKELPPPPRLNQSKDIFSSNRIAKSASSRNLKVNISKKMPRSLSMAKFRDHKDEQNQAKKGKLKTQDSVWTKTIILGEKCRVPDEDDAMIYDGKGNKIPAYHRKSPSSFPISRTNSYVDPERERKKKNEDEEMRGEVL